jgi:hypothetical protein
MTPAQFYPLACAWRNKVKREDYRAGVITYVIRRVLGDKESQPMDYFGGEKKKRSMGVSSNWKNDLDAYIAAKKEADSKKTI